MSSRTKLAASVDSVDDGNLPNQLIILNHFLELETPVGEIALEMVKNAVTVPYRRGRD